MKKILCVVLALTAIFAFAGCVNHNDGKCDECGADGKLDMVEQYDEKTELCLKCAAEAALDELESAASKD